MKLNRDEIALLVALVLALIAGAMVKQYRLAHPVIPAEKTPHPRKK